MVVNIQCSTTQLLTRGDISVPIVSITLSATPLKHFPLDGKEYYLALRGGQLLSSWMVVGFLLVEREVRVTVMAALMVGLSTSASWWEDER